MSRTHKTNPWWVNREWEPSHHIRCPHYVPASQLTDPDFVCDLPEEPPNRLLRLGWHRGVTRCLWWPDGPFYYSRTGIKTYGRPSGVHEDANLMEGGVRTAWRGYRQRVLSSRICEEGISGCDCLFNVVGDLEPPDPRHRHYAIWDMW